MSPDVIEELLERIIDRIDNSSLLGAAWDCHYADEQEKFKNRLRKTLREVLSGR